MDNIECDPIGWPQCPLPPQLASIMITAAAVLWQYSRATRRRGIECSRSLDISISITFLSHVITTENRNVLLCTTWGHCSAAVINISTQYRCNHAVMSAKLWHSAVFCVRETNCPACQCRYNVVGGGLMAILCICTVQALHCAQWCDHRAVLTEPTLSLRCASARVVVVASRDVSQHTYMNTTGYGPQASIHIIHVQLCKDGQMFV